MCPGPEEGTIRTFVRVNHQIRTPVVRCIDAHGNMVGVIPLSQARQLAEQAGLDLVEISPNADPPVCRIMDYGRYKYEQEKRERAARKSQAAGRLKEIKFHATVDEHDYQTKVRHLREFIQEGHRVRVTLVFRGRENMHQELGYEIMNRVLRDCQDIAQPDQVPTLMGRMLVMQLGPRRGHKPAKAVTPVHHSLNGAIGSGTSGPGATAVSQGTSQPAPASK